MYPSSSVWRQIQRMFIHTAETMTTSRHLSELALGRLISSPFSEKSVAVLRDELFRVLSDSGHGIVRGPQDRRELPFDFRLFHSLLSAAGDPEVKMHEFAVGVRVGPGTKLPRCPQIYSKQKKWRMQEQREQQEVDEQLAARGVWNTNYSSVHPLKHHVLDVLRDQAKRGQVLVLTQQAAKKRFPGLVVASMGAVKKEKDGGISARVVFDGTNGTYVNSSTHLRDQERSPVAGDIKRFMRKKARVGELTFGLTADIKEAHRQIPIHPSDWHMLGSQLESDGEVFINTEGTFGISSASYWWSRGRDSGWADFTSTSSLATLPPGYSSSQTIATSRWEDSTSDQRSWCSSCYATSCVVLCPGRRRQVVWSRTGWDLSFFSKNTRSVSRSVELPGSSLGPEKQQTRRWCTSGLLRRRWEEQSSWPVPSISSAFLAPLYAFSCSGSREGARPLPPYVSFFLRFLASSVERNRHTSCAAEAREESIAPCVDAQASDDRTGVGGWLPVLGPDGRPDPQSSPWFSEEITEHEFPWVFAKDGKSSRVIATLEGLALLLALRSFYPSLPSGARTKIVLVPSITDNRGNGSRLNKLMTDRYPLSALLMEFSERATPAHRNQTGGQMGTKGDRRRGGQARERRQRSQSLRVRVFPLQPPWYVLNEALEMGAQAEEQKKEHRAQQGPGDFHQRRGRKRKPEEKLRIVDPW